MQKLATLEKLGYAAGDAAANLVWRGALAYLAVFYTDTFGLAASAAAILFLVVRLSDGVTDIIMGMIADRTHTRWGRFRPWILWSTPFLGAFMVLCFTTPDLSDNGKLIYAYVTYIGLTLAYTVNNVPYSALMGVMTGDDNERTSLSGFRFAGAFLGGLFVMGFLPTLVSHFGAGNDVKGYQYTMYLFAALLMALMVITFATTRERISPPQAQSQSLGAELRDLCIQLPWILFPLAALSAFFYYRNLITGAICAAVIAGIVVFLKRWMKQPRVDMSSSQQDILDLLSNRPWLVLLGIGFLTMMFNGVKYATIAYYFKYVVGDALLTGQYFIALLVVSVAGALCTKPLADRFGRKRLLAMTLGASSVLTGVFFWVPPEQLTSVFIVGCGAEFFAAMMPTLFFSMLGDAADYSEYKNGRRATGLVYSAGTFVQKAGSGFAGALVLLVLAQYGYDASDQTSIEQAKSGMVLLMSLVPAIFSVAGMLLMWCYPIDRQMQAAMTADLMTRRNSTGETHA